jgi:uroporphyrinogen decarboxylase
MPFGLHSVVDFGAEVDVLPGFTEPPVNHGFPIQKPEDWDKVTPRRGIAGEYAVILESQRLFRQMRLDAVPFIQTAFSPLTTALKLAGEAVLLDHLRHHPDKVKRALEIITETTKEYVGAAVDGGADGIFWATQMSTKKITAQEHADFVRAYDLEVLDAVKGRTWFNILHIHGADTRLEELLDYPVQALNWHDRDDGPSLAAVRKLSPDKALVGGLSHLATIHSGADAEVKAQVEDAWGGGKNRGVILAPGCVASPTTTPERLRFIRKCVEETKRR